MKISRKVFLTAAASLCFMASAQAQAMKEINFGWIFCHRLHRHH